MANIIQETEDYVISLLTNELSSSFLYHNIRHTQRVVKSTQELLDFYKLDVKEHDDLLLAAWFHDAGYTKSAKEHEERSCDIAREFLKGKSFEEKRIENICNLILATKKGYEPKNLQEEIIRDADGSHLGKESYLETTEMLREELSLLGLVDYSPAEWRDTNIRMFQTKHRFYTEYAIKNWQETKDDNLAKLIKARKKMKKLVKKEKVKAQYKSEFKDKSPERGVQTMYRVTMRNHLKLSDIADTKANILLSVNAIIISLVLADLMPKLDSPSNKYLILPTALFMFFSVISMVLSIIATRPNITSGQFTKEDVDNKKVNLLFFGNFHKMKLEDYEWAMKELIKDQSYVYSSLTKDLYFLGLVLDRKYKLLRWTYAIFMFGMIVSVLSFFLALHFYGPREAVIL
ncbi:MAG: Pycsar system effector family protein [Cellulophaga sp.]|uniref:Pycsar system effector family protein n=1 Tax=unclassified Cellulophaga TaxID=2634405 RepID=UPI000C2B6EF1|nr:MULTISPECIES: Pycsar system effector family protein [unclassified Cellulophaga]MDO6490013.1 DUF5706 domain-containing protein [Cellulophaga sp. 2_MG-2023]MDO6494793.1 DUF5706 domain-containing protein [Cellulophaga sp. 3_MG-2023]PKB42354.1 putative metal-dependent HD superfamily phosphohydrolase [Cellulophaga sp. RHA19]